MAHLYKSRLQTYAQKRNIAFPMYACETQGPPHARLFKAQVTIDGKTYDGPEFCTTLKDAEHAAAKVALMALSPDGAQEDDCLYKSLLQELAQKKGLLLPVYDTNRTGPAHLPCFVSTVEVAGERYVGQEARTKKQAEMNAAKAAYATLTEGGPRANNAAAISDTRMVGTSSLGSTSLQTVETQKSEPTLMTTTSNMQATINNQASYSAVNETEKAGYLDLKNFQDVIEKHKMTFPAVAISQSQSKATPNVDIAKLSIRQENLVMQAGEGSSSDGKKSQSFSVTASNPLMDSGSVRSYSTKIVIRPHVQGMTYDGPIKVSDDEWVAMEVNVYENP